MDESKLREIVRVEVAPLMQRLGIPHWTIDFYYDLRESNGRFYRKAQCIRQVNYNRAAIDLDPSEFSDDDLTANLRTIRHELFHVLLSPYDLFLNAAEELWAEDRDKKAVLDAVWHFAQEQAVINLERMYQGLTESHQKETPPMGRQKTKVAEAAKAPQPKPKAGPKPRSKAPAPKGTKPGKG